jgi:hypothetical protein
LLGHQALGDVAHHREHAALAVYLDAFRGKQAGKWRTVTLQAVLNRIVYGAVAPHPLDEG